MLATLHFAPNAALSDTRRLLETWPWWSRTGGSHSRRVCHPAGSVALAERDRLGGNSLNTRSVPSTAIIRPVCLYGAMRNADEYGRARAI